MHIDTTFDFRSDSGGKDPDSHSPTLRAYHKFLWSRPLPNGAVFELDDSVSGEYLTHRSGLGEFNLSSDSVIQTFTRWIAMQHIVQTFTEAENEAFQTIGYTVGGMMIFPANRVDGKQTINGARGFNRKIADRMDLTLECIRRYYLSQDSPLGPALARYAEFFALFEGFRGYVDYFLLQDMVADDYSAVRFFMPFNDFLPPAVPKDIETYAEYRRSSIEFVTARNRRIAGLAGLPRKSTT